MDPDELFTVSTVSRTDVAKAVGVEPSDPRLTASFCSRYAQNLYFFEALFATDDEDEAISALNESMSEDLS
jgi:hypothetical protein